MKRPITKPELQALKIKREYLDGLWGVVLAIVFLAFVFGATGLITYILER